MRQASFDQRRVALGGGADDHPGEPEGEIGLDGGEVADAAAELGRDVDGLDDRLDGGAVLRLAGKGAVEIDDMQQLRPLLLPARRRAAGLSEKTVSFSISPCSRRTHLPSFKIDGGDDDHIRIFQLAHRGDACPWPRRLAPYILPEILQHLQPHRLALLRVELGGDDVVAARCANRR